MDTQRLILFVIFSFSALFLWEAWQREHRPPPPPTVTTAKPTTAPDLAVPAPAAGVPAAPGTPPGDVTPPAAAPTITVKTDLYTAQIDTVGGVIAQVALEEHRDVGR